MDNFALRHSYPLLRWPLLPGHTWPLPLAQTDARGRKAPGATFSPDSPWIVATDKSASGLVRVRGHGHVPAVSRLPGGQRDQGDGGQQERDRQSHYCGLERGGWGWGGGKKKVCSPCCTDFWRHHTCPLFVCLFPLSRRVTARPSTVSSLSYSPLLYSCSSFSETEQSRNEVMRSEGSRLS